VFHAGPGDVGKRGHVRDTHDDALANYYAYSRLILMKAPLPLLTRGESEVMRVLWDRGPVTVAEVVEALRRPIAYTTVLTVLRVLEQKGYVTSAKPASGRAYVYRATVPQQRARRKHLRDLLDRLFAGRPQELVTGLIESDTLSQEDLRALRQRIDEKLGRSRRRGDER
jgi:predicted transcriptional regulator